MRVANILNTVSAALAGTMIAGGAFAQDALETIGKPVDKALNFQPAATEMMRDIIWVDTFLLYIITAISVFVTALLIYCIVRFNKNRNPTPATFTHNSALEVAWTIVPIVVLIAIIPPSLTLLFKQQQIPTADITIKATGNQWYWTHEYVDEDFEFDSFLIGSDAVATTDEAFEIYKQSPEVLAFLKDKGLDADAFAALSEGDSSDEAKALLKEAENLLVDQQFRKSPATSALLKAYGYKDDEFLLATDTAVVVPVNKTIVVQVTGADVIHSWTIPAFGVKQDAVPGRLAELWFKADKEGVYFGQCSELCGKDHSYMPITVKVVSEEAYEDWLYESLEKYVGTPRPLKIASAN